MNLLHTVKGEGWELSNVMPSYEECALRGGERDSNGRRTFAYDFVTLRVTLILSTFQSQAFRWRTKGDVS